MNNRQVRRSNLLAAAVRQCIVGRRGGGVGVLSVSLAAAGLQLSTVGNVVRAQADGGLEEVVVTATRREQTVQEIPFNISALSGEALEAANIKDAVEALRTMAGISVQDRGYRNSGVTSGIVIRGINVDSGANGDVPLAAPATVATYVDNTALYGNFILKDVERIEVLRGPQGTLYGSGSLAGNVRYIMNKPDPGSFSGQVTLNAGVTDGSDGYNLNPDLLRQRAARRFVCVSRERRPDRQRRHRRLPECLPDRRERRPGRQRRRADRDAGLPQGRGRRRRQDQVRTRRQLSTSRASASAHSSPTNGRTTRSADAGRSRTARTSSPAASTASTSSAPCSSSRPSARSS